MSRIDDTVSAALGDSREGERRVTIPPAFQGLPGMAHGGTVLALFDAAAAATGPHRLTSHYVRRVPLGVPLTLRIGRAVGRVDCRLEDDSATLLVDGAVALRGVAASSPAATVAERGPDEDSLDGDRAAGSPLPVSATCFVCGTENRVGLAAAFEFDEDVVRTAWRPRPSFVRADGSIAPVALTALLDEAAFWLGALATGESGMTTELDVTVLRPCASGTAVRVAGERARVRPSPEDPRYLVTELVLGDDEGLVATARITFVAVRGAARRLANGLLAMNAPDVIKRVFPAYAPR